MSATVLSCRREQGKTPVVIAFCPCSHSDSATSAEAVAPAISFGAGMTTEQEARFWRYVVVVEDCWEWCGWSDRDGYGRFMLSRSARQAHRVSYEHHVGPIPLGLTLDHLCRNPRCVKPSHLEPVTMRENNMRGNGLPAMNARKTACLRGHSFSADNLAVLGDGKRACRACWRIRSAEYKARKKAQP